MSDAQLREFAIRALPPVRNVPAGDVATEPKRARVVHIIHPESAIRAHLFALVSREAGRLIFSYAAARDFLDSWRDRGAGAVLTAELLPDASGLEILEAIAGDRRMRGILVMAQPVFATAMAAHRMGVFDVVTEPLDETETCDLVTRALDAVTSDSRLVTQQRLAQSLVERLTARELSVAQMLAFGASNKAIARELDISVRTVEIHRGNLMRRLGLDSFAALVRVMLIADPAAFATRSDLVGH